MEPIARPSTPPSFPPTIRRGEEFALRRFSGDSMPSLPLRDKTVSHYWRRQLMSPDLRKPVNRANFPVVNAMGQTSRRDMLKVAAASFASVGAVFTAWPFVDQMNPNASVKEPFEVDLAQLKEGAAHTLDWRGVPLLLLHLTEDEIAENAVINFALLRDTRARNDNIPQSAAAAFEYRTVPGFPRCIVMRARCQREGCVVMVFPPSTGARSRSLRCPCCGSTYDPIGRIRKGPAILNLRIPRFVEIRGFRLRLA